MSKATQRAIHYSWIVLLLSFVGLLSAQGVRLSFGAFIQPWEISLNTDRASVSLVAFVSYLVFAVIQPLVGKAVDHFGVRVVFSTSVCLVGASTLLTFAVTEVWQLMILYGRSVEK